MNTTIDPTTKVVIIGLDGATPEYVFPMAQQGLLPNLARLMEDGAWGPIESTMPPFTQMAWPVFFTGCNPGKTGIFSYFDDLRAPNRGPATGRSLRAKPIWRILNEHGRRTIVVAVPVTYPPEKVDGVMISGMDAPDESVEFTSPVSLRETLLQQDYKIFPDRMLGYAGSADALYEECLRVSQVKTRVFTKLLREESWDFAMVVLNEVDVVSHFMAGEPVQNFYQETDKLVGDILASLDDNTVVLVISDHGVKPLKGRLHVNEILRELGLLTLKHKNAKSELLSRFGITREAARSLAYRLGVAQWLRRHAPDSLATVGASLKSTSSKELLDVDMSKTKVYLDSGWWLRLTEGSELSDSELKALQDVLAEYNGEVHRGKDLYQGPFADKAPDFIVYSPDYANTKALGTGERVGPIAARPGDHSMYGIGILAGAPQLVRGGQITGRLVDWTPTLLYLMGVPLPGDLDGIVLTQALAEALLETRPVESKKASKHEQLRQRVQALKAQGRI
jgi:predicted AlkP superfamily phosphohydrolase/phosphomutase